MISLQACLFFPNSLLKRNMIVARQDFSYSRLNEKGAEVRRLIAFKKASTVLEIDNFFTLEECGILVCFISNLITGMRVGRKLKVDVLGQTFMISFYHALSIPLPMSLSFVLNTLPRQHHSPFFLLIKDASSLIMFDGLFLVSFRMFIHIFHHFSFFLFPCKVVYSLCYIVERERE